MAGVELDSFQFIKISASCLHEPNRAVNFFSEPFITRVGGILSKAFVPTVDHAQISEAALGERPNQIQSGRCGVVSLEHSGRIRGSRFFSEVIAIDDVAAVRGKGHAISGLIVAGARLGKLASHPAHLHNGHRRTVGQHHGHLQYGLDPVPNVVSGGTLESLSAVATLKQESFPTCNAR
ncbi:unannotated protein [freshwater metagenome]|uniref:Unannotated protein n=1 Tax=freshwater metagenome TaxID=449393 RepID=A0A6J6KAW3_9ZZZZ